MIGLYKQFSISKCTDLKFHGTFWRTVMPLWGQKMSVLSVQVFTDASLSNHSSDVCLIFLISDPSYSLLSSELSRKPEMVYISTWSGGEIHRSPLTPCTWTYTAHTFVHSLFFAHYKKQWSLSAVKPSQNQTLMKIDEIVFDPRCSSDMHILC